jgi:HSP20 family protein
MAQFSFIPSGETTELAEDIRELFEDLAAHLKQEQRAYSGECHPSLDVLETDHSVEILMDVAGVPPDAIRVLFRASVVIIAGEKAPHAAGPHQSFHLVEREFGRFARAVRLNGAFDLQAARATMRNGELTVVLPKLEDRRNRPHRIPVTSSHGAAAAPSHPRSSAPSHPRPSE